MTADIAAFSLSQLLRRALDDLRSVEQDPRYKINMNNWHQPARTGEVCLVCLAGSVMARDLGAKPHCLLAPRDFRKDGVYERLLALDDLKTGHINDALGKAQTADGEHPGPASYYGLPDTVEVARYEADPAAFYRDMTGIADTLERAGL